MSAPIPVSSASSSRLADGEWHRLHPATPFLRGGVALIAIVGIVTVNLRDVLINLIFGQGGDGSRGGRDEGDPLVWVITNGLVGLLLLGILIAVAILVLFFYISWRAHSFRITADVVEVRSGILFRTNRKARLDRIQGINIQRPFLARIFGAARLEVDVAGQDANVKLEYLRSSSADELRLEILGLAAGVAAAEASATDAATAGLLQQRVAELLAPELDPSVAPPESVVTMHLGRLLGSIILSGAMFWLLVFLVGPAVLFSLTGEPVSLVVVIPGIFGVGGFIFRRFSKSLRYTIASTPDGIRVGYGLLSTSNETLPPGRIHAVEVTQPLLWRIPGWWEIKLNRASTSQAKGAAGQANTTILPVGNRAEVARVLELVLPGVSAELLEHGMVGGDGFTNSPRRARVLRPLSQRRNGFASVDGAVLLRTGALLRKLVVVPLARAQGITVSQGPVERRLRLAELRVHTVQGPVIPRIGALDAESAMAFFSSTADAVVASATNDTTHRWRATETPA